MSHVPPPASAPSAGPAGTAASPGTPAAGAPAPRTIPNEAAPARPTPAAPSPAPDERDAVEQLQRELERLLARQNTRLQFSVDDQARRVVVRVIDGAGETVIQIPTEAALRVARHLSRQGWGLVDADA